jgi:hypothetical protein
MAGPYETTSDQAVVEHIIEVTSLVESVSTVRFSAVL